MRIPSLGHFQMHRCHSKINTACPDLHNIMHNCKTITNLMNYFCLSCCSRRKVEITLQYSPWSGRRTDFSRVKLLPPFSFKFSPLKPKYFLPVLPCCFVGQLYSFPLVKAVTDEWGTTKKLARMSSEEEKKNTFAYLINISWVLTLIYGGIVHSQSIHHLLT